MTCVINTLKFVLEQRVDQMGEDEIAASRKRELKGFVFLTVFLAPALSVAIVGGYGFAIWIYQLLAGPPSYS